MPKQSKITQNNLKIPLKWTEIGSLYSQLDSQGSQDPQKLKNPGKLTQNQKQKKKQFYHPATQLSNQNNPFLIKLRPS